MEGLLGRGRGIVYGWLRARAVDRRSTAVVPGGPYAAVVAVPGFLGGISGDFRLAAQEFRAEARRISCYRKVVDVEE